MASGQEDLTASGKLLVSKLKPLAELITSDQPSVEDAVKLLGGISITTREKERYVAIRGPGYMTLLSLDESGKTDSITDIDITTRLEMDIEFHRNIEPLFGQWEETSKGSKYPAAAFTYLNSRTGKAATVYARLYWPPKTRVCPVLGIIIRLGTRPTAEKK